MADWQLVEEWGRERVDIFIMEARASLSTCFNAVGTSRCDLCYVISAVTVIRPHQGLCSKGQRRIGGPWGQKEDKAIKCWEEQSKERHGLFSYCSFFLLTICIFMNICVWLIMCSETLTVSRRSEYSDTKMVENHLPHFRMTGHFELNDEVY